MAEKSKRIKKKLVQKYRLVVLADDSFEEKFSFKLTRLNVFVFGGLFSLFLIVVTSILIIYTPLKEYIPGFESPELKKDAISLKFKLDAIEKNMHALELYTESLKPTLLGDKSLELDVLPFVTKDGESVYQSGIINSDSIHNKLETLYNLLHEKNNTINQLREKYKNVVLDEEIVEVEEDNDEKNNNVTEEEISFLETSERDSIFRENVEREERFSIFGDHNEKSQVFMTPVNGNVTEGFNVAEKHFAIDIASEKDAPVKAVADGMVVFAEWSLTTGYVIVILHQRNYVSVYKHNSKINVSQGTIVKSGQVIANVGSTGELSTGPHLHFEMWKDNYPVDPTNFMKF